MVARVARLGVASARDVARDRDVDAASEVNWRNTRGYSPQ